MRAAVQADERLAEHGELHRQFLASPGRRIVVRRRVARADMAVGEGRGIEFGGLAGFAIIEPQARRHRALAHRLSPHLPGAPAPKRTPWVSLATMMRSPPGPSIGPAWTVPPCLRSEEHTSELQSIMRISSA